MLVRLSILLLLSMVLMGATCEREVDLEIDEPDPRILLSSTFTLGEKVRVEVSKTQSLFDYSPPEYLVNAQVSLYQGDELLEELVLIALTPERVNPYYSTVDFEPQAGIIYTIKAAVDGFENVYAHSFIPESIPISDFEISDLSENEGSASYRKRYDYDLFFDYKDPVNTDNYYHLNIYQQILDYTTNDSGDTVITKSKYVAADLNANVDDIIKDQMHGGLLLKNNPSTEGYEFSLSFEITPEFQKLGKVFVELRTVSEEYYLFYSTFNRRQNQSNQPFTDPIAIYNNIENGQGYFAGYNSTLDSITVVF